MDRKTEAGDSKTAFPAKVKKARNNQYYYHFEGKPDMVYEIFSTIETELYKDGFFEVYGLKSVIVFRTARAFARFKPRKDRLDVQLVLSGPENVFPVMSYSKSSGNRINHFLSIRCSSEINTELIELFRQSFFEALYLN